MCRHNTRGPYRTTSVPKSPGSARVWETRSLTRTYTHKHTSIPDISDATTLPACKEGLSIPPLVLQQEVA